MENRQFVMKAHKLSLICNTVSGVSLRMFLLTVFEFAS